MGVIERNTPTEYEPSRIALRQNEVGDIVAAADFAIYNVDGQIIDTDHPSVTLTAGEASVFLTWFLGKLTEYEAATGLTRHT